MEYTVKIITTAILLLAAMLVNMAACTEKGAEDTAGKNDVVKGDTIMDKIIEPRVPTAEYRAERVFVVDQPSDYGERLALATLQGIAACRSREQIIIKAGAFNTYLTYMQKDFGCKSVYKNDDGKPWTTASLISRFTDLLDGYILVKNDSSSEGASVAVSIAGQLGAVVVTEGYEHTAKEAELVMLLDARELDDKWLRASDFWSNINRDVAVEQPVESAPKLVDYAVMTGAYFAFYNGTSIKAHTEKFRYLNSGAVVYGWNNKLGEYDTVASLSSINVCMVPADHAYNLSTLSGFHMNSAVQKTAGLSESESTSGKHTVCFIMSDGDNLQWLLNEYATSSKWYGSAYRGSFPIGWGLPATAIDVAAPMVDCMYTGMSENDEFLLQLSGVGYTFPSKWNRAELKKMAGVVAEYMERSDMSYLEVLDDGGFSVPLLSAFTDKDAVKGIFYIDYKDYSGMKGDIIWADGKPVVSAKYRLWANTEDGSIEAVAKAINASSTDSSSEEAYSFVIVHCWSGLDSSGRLVPDGDTMAAVRKVIEKLDSDVDVVTPGEFMERLSEMKELSETKRLF